jgi:prolyl oligopeptidase
MEARVSRIALRTVLLALIAVAPFVAALAEDEPPGGPRYPETAREDVVETMHGRPVPDPYRWLEDDDDPRVVTWDEAQLALLRSHLDRVASRDDLRKRIAEEMDLGGIASVPRFRGGKRWFTKRPEGANHPVLYVADAADEEGKTARVVIDPNGWSRDGTAGMKDWEVSFDGRHVAYERDEKGSENTTLHVLDVESGENLPDVIPRTKFTSIVWDEDGKGFLYTSMPDPASVPPDQAQYDRRVRHHVLGTLPVDDEIVYGQGRPMIESVWLYRSTDEKHVFLVRGLPYKSLDTFEVRRDTGATAGGSPGRPERGPRGAFALVPILDGHDSRTYVDRVGDVYLLNTDADAPRRRLAVARALETSDPAKWKEILPQREGVLQDAVPVGDLVLVHHRENVVSRLELIDLSGASRGEIALPGPGTVDDLRVEPGTTRVRFTFQSYSLPLTTYRLDVAQEGRPLTPVERVPTTVDVRSLTSVQTSYRSKDGTEVPIFLVHRKDAPPDGTRPTVLYGYGGFRVGMYPFFSRAVALWVERGGVWAVAALRGGDEFGEEWHEQGSLGNKQNVFDDFIAAADWLVESKKASRDRLAVYGGSNGGLLVAACVNQRPDLCRAVVCSVPLTDMLRFHRFQYARSWTMEYGDPDTPADFEWLAAYSPYHNVRKGAAYPAALVSAGLADGRVNAFHARKIAAQWQHATSSDRPVLLFVDRSSGHGAASVLQYKEELLDRYCFLEWQLGAATPPKPARDADSARPQPRSDPGEPVPQHGGGPIPNED